MLAFGTEIVHDKKQVGKVIGKDESKGCHLLNVNQLKLVNIYCESTVC